MGEWEKMGRVGDKKACVGVSWRNPTLLALRLRVSQLKARVAPSWCSC